MMDHLRTADEGVAEDERESVNGVYGVGGSCSV